MDFVLASAMLLSLVLLTAGNHVSTSDKVIFAHSGKKTHDNTSCTHLTPAHPCVCDFPIGPRDFCRGSRWATNISLNCTPHVPTSWQTSVSYLGEVLRMRFLVRSATPNPCTLACSYCGSTFLQTQATDSHSLPITFLQPIYPTLKFTQPTKHPKCCGVPPDASSSTWSSPPKTSSSCQICAISCATDVRRRRPSAAARRQT